MMTRTPVDVEIEYIPEDSKTSSPPTIAKFLRQVSLPANKYSDRFFRHRLFSMPGDYDADKKNGNNQKIIYIVLNFQLTLF